MSKLLRSENRDTKLNATTTEKAARMKEAGMRGRRLGEASSATKAAQARKDARNDLAEAAAPAGAKESGTARAKAGKEKGSPKSARAGHVPMIEVRVSHSLKGSAGLEAHVQEVVGAAVARFAERVTRVEVHLSDDNAGKGGDDKRCVIEARPASKAPVSTTATAATVHKAINAAAGKMKRLLSSHLAARK